MASVAGAFDRTYKLGGLSGASLPTSDYVQLTIPTLYMQSFTALNQSNATLNVFLDLGSEQSPDYVVPPNSFYSLPINNRQRIRIGFVYPANTTITGQIYVHATTDLLVANSGAIPAYNPTPVTPAPPPPVIFINVQDAPYNAKGDGTTDDTSSIQQAINAAGNAGGGTVFLPRGHFKITAALQAYKQGLTVLGAGWANQGNASGAIIQPAYGGADVFDIAADPGGGLIFQNFAVDRSGAIPTAGTTFKIRSGSNITVQNVWTNYSYDDILFGTSGSNICNQIHITDYVATNVVRYGVNVVGRGGNLNILNAYFGGYTTSYNAGTNVFLIFNCPLAADGVDPLYLKLVDVEGFGQGISQGGTGTCTDFFLDSVIIDGTTGGPCINFSPNASGTVNRGKIHNCWLTVNSGGYAGIVLRSGRNAGFGAGVAEIIVSNSNVSGNNNSGIFVGDGTRDVVITGNMVYGCGNQSAVQIGGTNTTRNVVVAGNRLGDVYGAGNSPNLRGVTVAPSAGATVDRVTIVGNDCTGNSANGLGFDFSAGTLTNLVVAENNLGGYANPAAAVSVLGTPTPSTRIRNNLGYNPLGQLTAPAIPASGTAQLNTFGVPVRVFIAGGTVSQIAVTSNGVALNTNLTGGAFMLEAGESITLTYTAAPSWVWVGL